VANSVLHSLSFFIDVDFVAYALFFSKSHMKECVKSGQQRGIPQVLAFKSNALETA
jgi:hypothetical protein